MEQHCEGATNKRRSHGVGSSFEFGAEEACGFLEATVAMAFQMPVGELRAPTRQRAPVAFARQIAMYMAHVVLELSLTDVGRYFGRDRTTAAHACRVVEERRDDPQIEQILQRIEDAIGDWREMISRDFWGSRP